MDDGSSFFARCVNRRQVLGGGVALLGSCLSGSLRLPVFAGADNESKHHADYVQENSDGTFSCLLCPNGCVLKEGETGVCRARGVRDGKYRSLVYGLPCIMALDPVEKMPLYHFHVHGAALSISTSGCNLHCQYCQNWQFSQKGPAETRNFAMTPDQILDRAVDSVARSVGFFYTEPIIYIEFMKDIAKGCRERDLRTIMVTAGYIRSQPLADLLPLIDMFVLGWKGFTQEFYDRAVGGRLADVQATMRAICAAGKHMEVVSLLIPTLNDDLEQLKKAADWFVQNLGPDVPWHFSRFVPEFKLKNLPPTPTGVLEKARTIALKAGVKFVYTGNNPGQEGNHTYCPQCGKMVVERLGFQVLKSLLKKGKCPFCQTQLPGIWLDDLPTGHLVDIF